MNNLLKGSGRTMLRCVAIFALVAGSAAHAAGVPTSLVVFGDSLSDTGNRFALEGGQIPVAPYFNGRFSNGPTYIDVLANLLGVSSVSSESGGTNFSVGGAEIATYNGAPTPPAGQTVVPPLTVQLDSYFLTTAGAADPDALYIVLAGGNDIRALGSGINVDLNNSAAAFAGIVGELSNAGATNILIPNLPNLGLTPEAQAVGPNGVANATFATIALNDAVERAVGSLEIEANVEFLDLFGLTNAIVADPEVFGFTNVTDACFQGVTGAGGPGAVCANPDSYLFWDQFHPTAAAHELIGETIYSQVIPIPAALPLFMAALGVLGLVRRKQLTA